jgi:hypothetical protein
MGIIWECCWNWNCGSSLGLNGLWFVGEIVGDLLAGIIAFACLTICDMLALLWLICRICSFCLLM